MDDTFKFVMPAELEKSADGAWKVRGLASTERSDAQGETIIQKGIDLTPIDSKQGYFNFDHKPGVENLLGVIDGYKRTDAGLFVEGRLFKEHDKAKAVYQIMSSLTKGDRGRCGLSVEGQVIERDKTNPKIIKKCRVKNVAITFNPVNQDTYADLIKSMGTDSVIEFASDGATNAAADFVEDRSFTPTEVMALIEKALGVAGGVATTTPQERSGGDALAQESMDKKPKTTMAHRMSSLEERKPGSLKRMSKALYKSQLSQILDKIQKLYPNNSRTELWDALQDRLSRKFPDLKD